jgi:ubiquinone/menaquinone biosynthesis C-methylase UbiE
MSIEPREIEAHLLQHPQVSAARVQLCEDEPGKQKLVAYVAARVPKPQPAAPESSTTNGAAIVDRWNRLYEVTYSTGPATPSFVGWNSSYTRQPIPVDQMQEWLHATLRRIQLLRPQSVLEIGCGVGLLLQHLAPVCTQYMGTDFSGSALSQLQRWMSQRVDLAHVELLHRSAVELQDIEPGRFDTVVLNSVVQYFPDVEYLLEVLRETVRIVGPDRSIFIGDVRHLGLLPMFHSAVQLSRAADSVTVGQLRRRVTRALAQETELAIDPELFVALPKRVPGISSVDVQLKSGRACNELTRYRYDVVLRTGEKLSTPIAQDRVEWRAAVGSMTEFERALRARRWCAICLSSVPNPRLAKDELAQRLIDTVDDEVTAGELRRLLDELQFQETDPERFWSYGESHDYEVSIDWGSPASPECFDVRIVDRTRADEVPRGSPRALDETRPWNTYANDPHENSLRQQLIPQLRGYLKGRLPEHLIPSDWTVVKQMPRFPGGDGIERL